MMERGGGVHDGEGRRGYMMERGGGVHDGEGRRGT